MGPAVVLVFWLVLAAFTLAAGYTILFGFRTMGLLKSSVWAWVAAAPGVVVALLGVVFSIGPYLIGPLLPRDLVYKVLVGETQTPDVVIVDAYARGGTDFFVASVEFRAAHETFERVVNANGAKASGGRDEGLDDPIYSRGQSCADATRYRAESSRSWESMTFVDCRDTKTYFVSGSSID